MFASKSNGTILHFFNPFLSGTLGRRVFSLEQVAQTRFRRQDAMWQSNQGNAKPQLPYGVRVYAIGDIHGRADLLSEMFTVIDTDLARSMPPHPIQVFLGDYVDRGPDSSKTLDLLIRRSRNHKTVFLKGNHEAYMLDVLRDPSTVKDWRQFGGLQT